MEVQMVQAFANISNYINNSVSWAIVYAENLIFDSAQLVCG